MSADDDGTISWSAPPPAPSAPPPAAPWGAGAPSEYGAPAGYGPPPGWPPPGAPGPGPQGSGRGVWVAFGFACLLALAATVFLVVAVVVTTGDDDPDAQVATETSTAEDAVTTTLPGGRLAPEPPIPTTDGPHEWFYEETDGDPVAWDPCDAIHYVVNDELAPEGAMEIMDDAIALVEQATGLVFVDDGPTDEMAPVGVDGERADSDPARYGDGWSPVLISWTDAMAHPELDGAAGLANPTWREAASGERVYITGYIEMAGDYAADLIAQGGRDDVLGIMMHELGHLVGLAHVTPSDQVMTDDPNSTPSVWGTGDLVGLATVGRGECEPDL
ncbi:MAG TPA: hypothetical protein VF228_12525 [Iamia sp.]